MPSLNVFIEMTGMRKWITLECFERRGEDMSGDGILLEVIIYGGWSAEYGGCCRGTIGVLAGRTGGLKTGVGNRGGVVEGPVNSIGIKSTD